MEALSQGLQSTTSAYKDCGATSTALFVHDFETFLLILRELGLTQQMRTICLLYK
jgi:hypothetical protein